ncbi:MAG: carbohydrate-binding protein [Spirochaetales bacterium]|nr:carbohydrate-binding protein [Spirochaetales bacterium]
MPALLLFTDNPVVPSPPRGRVRIDSGTIVTDKGTLLRGCRVSTDWDEKLPKRSEISAIKELGLNAVHLYAESFVKHTPGELHELVDTLVKWTAEESLYLIITIGCLMQNHTFNYEFALGFWEYYAPRYADYTHVLYEIHNEPSGVPPYPSKTIDMEREVYSIIRKNAPHTHILFFSYPIPKNPEGIFKDIIGLGKKIDWTNCSIAIHSYEVTEMELETTIREVKAKGYSVLNTEPCSLSPMIVNFRQSQIHEKFNISYLHFLLPEEIAAPEKFKLPIENAEITWKPDFGSWPSGTPSIVAVDAFSRKEAEHYNSQGGPSGIKDMGPRIGFISNDDYAIYNYLDFADGAIQFEARVASGGIGGWMEILLDSLDGQLIGKMEIKPTGGWDKWITKTCPVKKVNGKHKVVLHFKGGQYDLFDIDWFQFIPAALP